MPKKQTITAPTTTLEVVPGPLKGRDPTRMGWPPRLDEVLTLAFLLGVGYCVWEKQEEAVTITLIVAALLSGLSWRMRGKWGAYAHWGGGDASLGGEFADPFDEPKRLPRGQPPQAPPPARAEAPPQEATRGRKPSPKKRSAGH